MRRSQTASVHHQSVLSSAEQIRAILSPSVFRWAVEQLPAGRSIDDVKFSDLISVTEDEIFTYVQENGFDPNTVVERRAASGADDRICLLPEPDGRWRVYYIERGIKSGERVLPSEAEARREVVRDLLRSARIALNHRYRLAHPEEDLPSPSEM